MARPRGPLPPIPEFAPLFYHETFDQAYSYRMTNAQLSIANYGELIEGWSGYAIQRSGVVTPFVIPALNSAGQTNFACDSGTVRFWLKPYYGSSGTGPGVTGRLIDLVAVDNKQSLECWSLQVRDSRALYLIAQGDTEPVVLLQAPIDWQSDTWQHVALEYGPAGTKLFLNGERIADGPGTLAIPPNVAQLVVGSTLAGTETPEAEFDEIFLLGRFDENSFFGRRFLRRWPTDWAVACAYGFASSQAARGAISAEEDAAWREMVAKMRAEREAAGEGGGQMMMLLSGTSECITNSPLYITNIVSTFVTNQGWTVTFDVQGTNSPADIFTATNLLCDSITNSSWIWLERGPTCSTYQYTNQPSAQAFYVLGNATVDPDGDGLSTAYEQLVSKTDPGSFTSLDSDGDGLPDGWELANGTNPAVADNNADPDGDGLTNYQEYLGGTDPLVSAAFAVWISVPRAFSNLP